MTAHDLFAYAETHPQNWRRSDPPTSRDAGLSVKDFRAEHHSAILHVLKRSGQPLAAEQIADAIGFEFMRGRVSVCLDYVAVGKRLIELIESGAIERTPEQHVNRSGRKAFKLRIRPQFETAAGPKPAPHG